MAYTLQAIITDRQILGPEFPEAISVAELPQEMCMIPLTETFREAGKIALLPLIAEELESLPPPLAHLCATLSNGRKLVYVEAEFFAGDGTQACALWEDAQQHNEVIRARDAINTALAFLGVSRGKAIDEFAALDLGKYRDTELWLDAQSA